jgi:hypothetical protein
MIIQAGNNEQEAVYALAGQPGLTPDQVMDRWLKALNLATEDIIEARLGPGIQGLVPVTRGLEIDVRDGSTCAFMAAATVTKPAAYSASPAVG